MVATEQVVKHIEETKAAKLAYWGPQMKDGAPKQVYVPQVLAADSFTIDGEKVEIRQPQNHAAFVWIPANKAILGGTGVAWGMHVWTADTQSAASRQQWRQTLSDMAALHPQQVIRATISARRRRATRLSSLPATIWRNSSRLKAHKDSASVIKAMKAQYPGLAEESSLELSAKVNTGEMKW